MDVRGLAMKNRSLEKLLLLRSFDVTKVAEQIFGGRGHVTRVLLGMRVGTRTWPKLKKVLTPEEYRVAKEYADAEWVKREKEGKAVGRFRDVSSE